MATHTDTTIAFAGTGTMGTPIACHLAQAGFRLRFWNRSERTEAFAQIAAVGGQHVPRLEDLTNEARWIITCLGDGEDVADVVRRSGLLDGCHTDTTLIDLSTIGIDAAQGLAATLGRAGLRFVDAPLTGGDAGAKAGTLTVMVGATLDDFERAQPILQPFAGAIHHCGPVGSGQAVKLCNQLLCAIHTVALREVFALARHLRVDPAQIVSVCSTGAAGSWALQNLGPRVLSGDFDPGFSVKHMTKDVRLATTAAGDLPLPLLASSTQAFESALEDGLGDRGTQIVARG